MLIYKTKLFQKYLSLCNYRTLTHKNVLSVLESQKIGEKIQVKGWIKSLRKLKENTFFDLSDGSSDKKLQVLISNEIKPTNLTTGASVSAVGCLNLTPKGQYELHAENVQVLGECVLSDGYPFLPRKTYTPEYVRQYLHLRPQTNKFSSLLRIRSKTMSLIHKYLETEGYININTPILTSNDCEGAGEVFNVRPENETILKDMVKQGKSINEAYFDTKTYLTVSGQLHLEAACHGLSKVYTFGPTFRAENSRSRLHLSEFYMLEAEIAFIDDIEQLIGIIEDLVKNVTNNIVNSCGEDIKKCQGENEIDLSWAMKKFPTITYNEAVDILNNNKGKYAENFIEDKGFAKEHEMFIVKYCGDVPTFIINWPKHSKPFYMRECSDDDTKVAALDLLAPNVGEIVGGSLRENNYEKLKEKLHKVNTNLDWYLELRKYGGVPTGGFGLGFERYLQLILGISNIKDTIPFPRWPHNCSL